MARTDTASRIVQASPSAVYSAFIDPTALAAWLPPKGMHASIEVFDPREGGIYRITLRYDERAPGVHGKASDDTDVAEGRFVELVPDERIVQSVTFESDDPAFAGEMTMCWLLDPVPEGARVTIICENVPPGISAEDHQTGLASTLENLAAYLGG